MAITLPGWLWLHDHGHYRSGTLWQKAQYVFHWFLIFLGAFVCVGGTYAVVDQIKIAYDTGAIGKVFSCADNANTHGSG